MRATIDIPDSLLGRVKQRIHKNNMTFRSLAISALERALDEETSKHFQLRDASVGKDGRNEVSSQDINRLIDEQRESKFRA
jgi:hypothetical protein